MGQVSVTINGRQYRMACEDGQEEHLLRLAQDFDRRIENLRATFGEVGDMRLAIMAAITVADESTEAVQRIQRLEEEVAALQGAQAAATDRQQATEAAVIAALNAAAERIEKVTSSLNGGLAGNGAPRG